MTTSRVRHSGFTIVEVLVVISIIGLLSSVVIASMNSARQKARFAAAKQLDGNSHRALGDSLAGEWLFDECSGSSARDTSGNGNVGTLVGSPTWSTDTPIDSGCSLSFSGVTGKYVNIPNTPGTNPASFTVSAWVKPATTASALGVFQKSGWDYSLCQLSGGTTLRFYVWNPGGTEIGSVSGSATIRVNTWYFATVSFQDNTSTVYFNGTRVGTNASAVASSGTGVSIHIGDGCGAGMVPMNGLVDNVRIYDRALDVAEIQKLYAVEAPRHQVATTH